MNDSTRQLLKRTSDSLSLLRELNRVGQLQVISHSIAAINTHLAQHDVAQASGEPAEQVATPTVDVATMQESHRTTYWTRVSFGGRELHPYMSEIRGRAEYDAATWAWLFNGGEKPCTLDFDTEPDASDAETSKEAPASTDLRKQMADALGNVIGDAYDCTRVWEAWGVGTMSQDDFVAVADRLDEIVDAVMYVLEQNSTASIEQAAPPEYVAEVRSGWTLVWAGSEPLAKLLARHPGVRIGTKLYAHPPAQAPLQSVGPWVRTLARLPGAGQLIIKRWDHNRAVWAGLYSGSNKDSSFDEWCLLEPAVACTTTSAPVPVEQAYRDLQAATAALTGEILGSCCYGGMKPRSACAGCAAWSTDPMAVVCLKIPNAADVMCVISRAQMVKWFDAFTLDRCGCVFETTLVAGWIAELLSSLPYAAGPGASQRKPIVIKMGEAHEWRQGEDDGWWSLYYSGEYMRHGSESENNLINACLVVTK